MVKGICFSSGLTPRQSQTALTDQWKSVCFNQGLTPAAAYQRQTCENGTSALPCFVLSKTKEQH